MDEDEAFFSCRGVPGWAARAGCEERELEWPWEGFEGVWDTMTVAR